MHDDQREQSVVQALQSLPAPGFEFPQGEVIGYSEQANDNHCGGQPSPIAPAKRIGQWDAIRRKKVKEDSFDKWRWRSMNKKSDNHMDHTEDGCPHPHVTD